MRSKQRQELSDLTTQAVQVSDMESLVKIYQVILQDMNDNPFDNPDGMEWFWILVPADWWDGIKKQAKTS